MKKQTAVLALAASFALALCGSATAKTLSEIHGSSWPQSIDGFTTKNQCLACHGSYESLGEKTQQIEPNPHRSHLGEVDCVECHLPDKSKPELMCNDCHKF